ncbi:MAG: RNA methyltransferase [Rickettsiales bacterium]
MLTPETRHLNPPTVILDRPQMGENIGAVARAMMNFGMRELRLVNPRDGWPNPKAHEMSANADVIIEAARVYDTFSSALADCHFVIAATARKRELEIPTYTPRESASLLLEKMRDGEKVGIVLGGERAGLANEDIVHCQAICTIPTDPANASLNIAQSMVILGYEWWMATLQDAEHSGPEMAHATNGERQALYEHLVWALDNSQYFQHEGRALVMQRNLRSMLARLPLTSQQIQSLRGMIRALMS